MHRKLHVFASFALVVILTGAASASHIMSESIVINGVPVASGNSFTNPTISVVAGANNVTFGFDLFSYSSSSSPFVVTFGGAGFVGSGSPASDSSFFNGSGTPGNPVPYSFTRSFLTPGTFNLTLSPNLTNSFPNYHFPGGDESLTSPAIPFVLQVNAAAVPEPASIAVWGLFGGIGLVGSRLRKRWAKRD